MVRLRESTDMATKKPARKSAARKPDALRMLKDDHDKVKGMFEKFKSSRSDDKKAELAEMICRELTIHTQLEEEIFYPAVREAIDEADLMDEALVEHASAKELIEDLEQCLAEFDGLRGTIERLSGTDAFTPNHVQGALESTLETVRNWRDAGAVIQTDATMLLARGPMTELAKAMLAEGLIDCLASDNHGDRRSLAAARVWLEEMGAEEHAHVLTHGNAARVLANEPTIPVPPLPLGGSVFRRLRELLFGRR